MHADGHNIGSYMLACTLSCDSHVLCVKAWQLVEPLSASFAGRHMPRSHPAAAGWDLGCPLPSLQINWLLMKEAVLQ